METLSAKVVLTQESKDCYEYAKNALREKVFTDFSSKLAENKWMVIRLRVRDSKDIIDGTKDPLAPRELITELETQPAQNEYVKITSFIEYKKVKGFWKRLKLLFSKKPIYIEETRK